MPRIWSRVQEMLAIHIFNFFFYLLKALYFWFWWSILKFSEHNLRNDLKDLLIRFNCTGEHYFGFFVAVVVKIACCGTDPDLALLLLTIKSSVQHFCRVLFVCFLIVEILLRFTGTLKENLSWCGTRRYISEYNFKYPITLEYFI